MIGTPTLTAAQIRAAVEAAAVDLYAGSTLDGEDIASLGNLAASIAGLAALELPLATTIYGQGSGSGLWIQDGGDSQATALQPSSIANFIENITGDLDISGLDSILLPELSGALSSDAPTALVVASGRDASEGTLALTCSGIAYLDGGDDPAAQITAWIGTDYAFAAPFSSSGAAQTNSQFLQFPKAGTVKLYVWDRAVPSGTSTVTCDVLSSVSTPFDTSILTGPYDLKGLTANTANVLPLTGGEYAVDKDEVLRIDIIAAGTIADGRCTFVAVYQ